MEFSSKACLNVYEEDNLLRLDILSGDTIEKDRKSTAKIENTLRGRQVLFIFLKCNFLHKLLYF